MRFVVTYLFEQKDSKHLVAILVASCEVVEVPLVRAWLLGATGQPGLIL
jgi:hypothetical protein